MFLNKLLEKKKKYGPESTDRSFFLSSFLSCPVNHQDLPPPLQKN